VQPELRARVEARLGVTATNVVRVEEGWDSSVFEVNREWIVRVPRRDEVRGWMRKEVALLGVLAPALPVPAPCFEAVEDAGPISFVAYRKLDGDPLDSKACRGAQGGVLAAQLGAFLTALHAFPRASAIRAGIAYADASGWLEQQRRLAERCEHEVMPLLDRDEWRRAQAVFDDFFSSRDGLLDLDLVLVHGDLGPAHILRRGSAVSGVIDWSDACLGDPALDLAWLVYGTSSRFAEALLDAYAGDTESHALLRARALFYHRLGPWHEVLYGLESERPELVASGLAGIRQRLPPC
jgi:aminoglycoside phosphotransferase (APT) family kinase protein